MSLTITINTSFDDMDSAIIKLQNISQEEIDSLEVGDIAYIGDVVIEKGD